MKPPTSYELNKSQYQFFTVPAATPLPDPPDKTRPKMNSKEAFDAQAQRQSAPMVPVIHNKPPETGTVLFCLQCQGLGELFQIETHRELAEIEGTYCGYCDGTGFPPTNCIKEETHQWAYPTPYEAICLRCKLRATTTRAPTAKEICEVLGQP